MGIHNNCTPEECKVCLRKRSQENGEIKILRLLVELQDYADIYLAHEAKSLIDIFVADKKKELLDIHNDPGLTGRI